MPDNEPNLRESKWRKLSLSWPAFFAVLFASPLLTVLTVTLVDRSGNAAPDVAICSAILCGGLCGSMLGNRIGKTTGERIGLGILFTAIMFVACISMSFFGCLTTGYLLNLH
jgi:hypothetical protein